MGLGYTTLLYDGESLHDGLVDISACRYDGVEIGLEKVEHNGVDAVGAWLDECDLDCYLVMGGWLETDEAADRIADGAAVAAELGAPYLGVLPPQRGRVDDDEFAGWLDRVCAAASAAGVTPLLHHHGATHVEQPDEIGRWLDRSPDELQLLFDTAHYYPYADSYPGSGVVEGIRRFADDIEYFHLKDIDPTSDFDGHRDRLSAADFHLDDVVNYFRTFTDLGRGILDFTAVAEALDGVGYDGNLTIEIENQTMRPLVHAKTNIDYWEAVDPARQS